jgi:hypothetical protein
MASSATATITTSPTRLDNRPGLHQGQTITIRNHATAATEVVNLGGESVSASQGYGLANGAQLQIGREPIWAIRSSTATGNIAVSVLSLG